MRATIAILLVLLGAGCEKRGRTRNSSASALFEEGAVATTSVYRFTSVDRSRSLVGLAASFDSHLPSDAGFLHISRPPETQMRN